MKNPGRYPEAGVLTFQKNAKSIFSKDNATLCSSLEGVLGLSLKIEIPRTDNERTKFWFRLHKTSPCVPIPEA
ncbi:hypothetical protein SESBI_28406, partial [Sesbania bispinosa]